MIAHDDELLDAIACLALGVLPEAEALAVAEHVRGCDECRRTYAELRATADAVGYAAEPPPGVPDELSAARMRSRVMSAVRESVAQAPSANNVASHSAPERARGETPWFAYLATAAALALAVLAGLDDLSLRSAGGRDARQIAALQTRAEADDQLVAHAALRTRDLTERIAEVTAPGAKHFAVPGGEVIESGGRVLIALRNPPAPPPGKVYQAWTLRRGAKAVAPSITFSPDASGVTLIELPESSANLAAVALSVEPAGGSKAPTSTPTFVRALS